jgi:hypothetical protein
MDNHRYRLLFLATSVYLGVLLLAHTVTSGTNPLPAWLNPGAAILGAQLGLILAPALLFAWLARLPFRDTFKCCCRARSGASSPWSVRFRSDSSCGASGRPAPRPGWQPLGTKPGLPHREVVTEL